MEIKEKFDGKEALFSQVLTYLPFSVSSELLRLSETRRDVPDALSEIRLRQNGSSRVTVGGCKLALSSSLGKDDLEQCLCRITGGSLFAYRDTIAEGYVPLPNGVRVGVSGSARYEGGKLIGVSEVGSLNFRIPTPPIEIPEMSEALSLARRGLLVFSPPGIGKTTALKALVRSASRGRTALNVCVIDERREFPVDDFKGSCVDFFSGYRRRDGIEMALRSMSPELMVIDEISGAEEAELIAEYLNSGVRIAASAHAGNFEELMQKKNLAPFFNAYAFDVFVGIIREKNGYRYDVRCGSA